MSSVYDREKAKKEQKIKEAEKKLEELNKKLKEASKEEKEDIKNRIDTVKQVIFTNKGFLKVLKHKHGVEESLSNKEIIEGLANLTEDEIPIEQDSDRDKNKQKWVDYIKDQTNLLIGKALQYQQLFSDQDSYNDLVKFIRHSIDDKLI